MLNRQWRLTYEPLWINASKLAHKREDGHVL